MQATAVPSALLRYSPTNSTSHDTTRNAGAHTPRYCRVPGKGARLHPGQPPGAHPSRPDRRAHSHVSHRKGEPRDRAESSHPISGGVSRTVHRAQRTVTASPYPVNVYRPDQPMITFTVYVPLNT